MGQQICVLGLGLMGARAVVRLAECGHKIVAWNRTSGPRVDGVAKLATIASSPCEAVRNARTVLIFLHDARSVAQVLLDSGAASCLANDALVIDMGTNTPHAAREMAFSLPHSVRFVDAPVSGGIKGVELGTLSIFLGAEDENVSLARAALSDLGRVSHMGGVGMGQAAKLANQIVVACSIAGLAEGIAYGEMLGLEAQDLISAMQGGLADGRVLEMLGPRIAEGDFAPRGRASTHLKDIECAFSEMKGAEQRLGATATARKYLQRLVKQYDDPDHGAMVLCARDALSDKLDFSPD